jgi:hypothetical protein
MFGIPLRLPRHTRGLPASTTQRFVASTYGRCSGEAPLSRVQIMPASSRFLQKRLSRSSRINKFLSTCGVYQSNP